MTQTEILHANRKPNETMTQCKARLLLEKQNGTVEETVEEIVEETPKKVRTKKEKAEKAKAEKAKTKKVKTKKES